MSLVSLNVILGAVPETVTVPLFAVKLPLAIKFPVTSIPAAKSVWGVISRWPSVCTLSISLLFV